MEKSELSIVNLMGQKALEAIILPMKEAETVLNISKLPAGVYFVQLSNETHRFVSKFVKE